MNANYYYPMVRLLRFGTILCAGLLSASFSAAEDKKPTKPDPCQPGVGWLKERPGITYLNIEVEFVQDVEPKTDAEKAKQAANPWFKTTDVLVSVTGQKDPVQLKREEWIDLQNGCAAHNVKPELKKKLGLPPAGMTRGPAVMAALTSHTGDLNRDGLNDRVRIDSGTLFVDLNHESGTLRPSVRYTPGPNPQTVLMGDFSGDGKPDVALAISGDFGQSNGGVAVLINNGDGTLRAPVLYAQGGSATSLAIGDFNGDQRRDIAVVKQGASNSPGTLSILLGNGNGTFQAPVTLATGAGPSSVVAADFTGDGKLDLAVANRDAGSLSVFTGGGAGNFASAVHTPVGTKPEYLGASDLNGDGRYDLVVLHRNIATLSVWTSLANGGLQFSGRYLTGVRIGSFVILDDPDSDRPTIMAPDAARTRLLVYGVGSDGLLYGSAPAYEVPGLAASLALADVNGDTLQDIVVAGSPAPAVLFGAPDAKFQEPRSVPIDSALGGVSSVAARDFNGDGRADLALTHYGSNRVSIQTGRGDGTFQPSVTLTGVTRPLMVSAVDLNGDGAGDLAVLNEGQQNQGNLVVFLGTSNGTFGAPATYPTGPRAKSLATGDLNGDGRPDLVVVNAGDNQAIRAGLRVLLTNANGTLQQGASIDAGVSASAAAIADFTGDGKADIAFAALLENSPNFLFAVSVLPGNGDGTFGARITTKVESTGSALVAADLDRDGKQDLVAPVCCGATDLTRLLGRGDGTFDEEFFAAGADPGAAAVSDLDKDGYLDILILDVPNDSAGVVTVLAGGPDFAIQTSAATNKIATLAPNSIAAAFGTGLATTTAQAAGANWPQTLGGTSVRVRDETGAERDARIYFVSPGQVNYLMPAETAPGFVLVSITSGDGLVTQGLSRIAPVGPGLFSLNSSGLAAAQLVRVLEDGTQVTEPVFLVSIQNQILTRQLDLGPDSQQEVLVLYATGVRGRSSLANVRALIGGTEATVLYAGPQNEYPGLDQVNLIIPKSLRGRGVVDIQLLMDDVQSNVVNVRIR